MKKLIKTISVAAIFLAVQGCTVTISSADSMPHSHGGIKGSKGDEGVPKKHPAGMSGGNDVQSAAAGIRGKGALPSAIGPQGTGTSASVAISPKRESGLNAKNMLDAVTAIVLGCIQYKC
ncbi:MAG: hypothetical protein ACPGVP_18050 [Thiolinea sp.]